MTSNSKLNQAQKIEYKELRESAKFDGVKLASNGLETVAYEVKGNTVEFSLATMSPDEQKFRRKVGAFYALSRFYYQPTQTMSRGTFDVLMAYAEFTDKAGNSPQV